MEDLIEALNIFLNYTRSKYPFVCTHDVLYISELKPSSVSTEHINRLEELGFIADFEEEWFYSYRYGSC